MDGKAVMVPVPSLPSDLRYLHVMIACNVAKGTVIFEPANGVLLTRRSCL